jgi:ribosomal protein L37AE/L43A
LAREPGADAPEPGVDMNRCTRCGRSWRYDIVEQVEIWSCSHCGYEVRERSADHAAMMDARQESMST